MILSTLRFGDIEIPDEKVLTFPAGLPGFGDLSQWCLLHSEGVDAVNWLQSLEDPTIALIIADPEAFFFDYDVEEEGFKRR